tara:strand:- start:6812 stop:7393 length:582 start_codon:yes stop_codon:yes gene_type:complete
MGRKAGFRDEDVFASVATLMAHGNGVALRDLSKDTGVSIGSLYHRFDGMDAILAETWLWAAESFQSGFVDWLTVGTHRGGLRAAVQLPLFCQTEPKRALALVGAPTTDYLKPGMPAALAARVAALQERETRGFEQFTTSAQLDRDAAALAVFGYPKAVVQCYLPQRPVPDIAQMHVRNAYWAALKLGEIRTLD